MSDLSELTELIDASNRAFEEFKKANDAQLAELKKNGAPSADLAAKIEAITKDFGEQKSAIERLELKMKRPGIAFEAGRVFVRGREIKGYTEDETQAEHRKLFMGYLRKGQGYDLGIELKGTGISSGPERGFALPKVIDAMIEETIVNVSPIRGPRGVVERPPP